MAWEKLGSTKLALPTASIDDDFSGTDNFTAVPSSGQPSGWGVTSGAMNWTTFKGSTVQGEYIALPSTFSGNFVVRFKLTPTTVAYAGTEEYLWVGLTNSNSCNSATSQNQAGFYFHNYSSSDSKYQVTYGTNTGLFGGAVATSINFSSTAYWIEIMKNGDSVKLTLYSDEYVTPVTGGTATSTAGGATDSYTHFILTGMYHGSLTGNGSNLGTIDDLEIYDGISIGDTISVDCGTDANADFTADLSSSSGWTPNGTGMAVDTGNEEIDYTNLVIRTDTNQKISYDLGSGNVSNDKWVLRYTLTPSDFSADSAVFGFISDTINPNLENNTDSIGTAINSNGGNTFFTGSYSNGDKLNYTNLNASSGGTALTNGTSYYVEIKRTSATTVVFTIRTGSHSGTTYGSYSGATLSTVVGLQYIVFGNANWGDGSATGSGTIKDIKFYNGITEVTSGKKHLQIQIQTFTSGAQTIPGIRFNNDSGSSYTTRDSNNGGTDATETGTTIRLSQDSHGGTVGHFFVNAHVINELSREKSITAHSIRSNATGSGTAPAAYEIVSKWTNTSSTISTVDVINEGTGDFAEGSEVTVYGTD